MDSFYSLAWYAALIVLLSILGLRLLEYIRGRRERPNLYAVVGMSLIALFFLLHSPSPLAGVLRSRFPEPPGRLWVIYLPYSLIIWGTYFAVRIGQNVYGSLQWRQWVPMAVAVLTQAVVLWTVPQLDLGGGTSVTLAAQQGDIPCIAFVGVLIAYGAGCTVYMCHTFTWLARRDPDRLSRVGQRTAAAGLAVFLVAMVEEIGFLVGVVPQFWHNRVILVMIAAGSILLCVGTLLFSREARRIAASLPLLWTYVRLRPLGQAIARQWPGICLHSYPWWTVFDLYEVRMRLFRIVVEWMDVRRTLTAYLPDSEIPRGEQSDVCAEAAYLVQGLSGSLQPRREAGNPASLSPVPEGVEEGSKFLLRVLRDMRRLERGAGMDKSSAALWERPC